MYNYIEYLFDDYFIASKEDGNLGIINSKNNVLIDFKYDVIQKIGDTKIVQAKTINKDKSDFYSDKLEQLVSMNDAIVIQEKNYLKITNNSEMKYFDLQGNEIESKSIFEENKLLAYKKGSKWGFVDRNDQEIVECKYDKVTQFNQYGFAGICIDNKWGVIDENAQVIVEPKYKIAKDHEPEFIGEYYKVYYGYGESYFTNNI